MNIKEAVDKNLVHDATPRSNQPTQLQKWQLVFTNSEGHVRYSTAEFFTEEVSNLLRVRQKLIPLKLSNRQYI